MSNSTKNWYTLYTRPGCEKKVANLLSRKNFENYCPMKRQWNGRKKVVLEPLFNSYVFVQITESEIMSIRKTDGVLNFVHWLGKPAVIQEAEIEIIKRFMDDYSFVKLEKIPFDIAGNARIISGLSAENKSKMISVINNQVKIVLPSLGYMMLAEVEKSNVEIITAAKQSSYTIVENYKYAF